VEAGGGENLNFLKIFFGGFKINPGTRRYNIEALCGKKAKKK
jgi:hypothetical protein